MTDQLDSGKLQYLPCLTLEKIFNYLPYGSMFKLSKMCTQFRQVAVSRMRLGFTKLVPIIRFKCDQLNRECEQLFSAIIKDGKHESDEYKNMLKLGMTLKMLLSEVEVLHAVCSRYDPHWNYFCAHSGQLLDSICKLIDTNFSAVLRSNNAHVSIQEIVDKFLYTFLMRVASKLNTNIPFGTIVVDILACLRNCNLKGSAKIDPLNGTLYLSERYQFINATFLIYPFDVGNLKLIEEKLNCILYMLAVNVRYHNFCYFFKEQGRMEELLSIRQRYIAGLLNKIRHNHLSKLIQENKKRNISHNNIPWKRISQNEFCREIFIGKPSKEFLSFKCKLKLRMNDQHNYPYDMVAALYASQCVTTVVEDSSTIYDFWIDIDMRHLNQEGNDFKNSNIKVVSHKECFLSIYGTTVMANDEFSTNPKFSPAFIGEPSEDNVIFIPLEDNHDKSTTNVVRRNDFFYAKNLKTLPRIGRRNGYFSKEPYGDKRTAKMERRDDVSVVDKEHPNSWPWPKAGKYIPIIVKKNTGYIDDDTLAGHP